MLHVCFNHSGHFKNVNLMQEHKVELAGQEPQGGPAGQAPLVRQALQVLQEPLGVLVVQVLLVGLVAQVPQVL